MMHTFHLTMIVRSPGLVLDPVQFWLQLDGGKAWERGQIQPRTWLELLCQYFSMDDLFVFTLVLFSQAM